MKRILLIAPLVVVGLLAAPAEAETTELEPSRGPTTQGPVALEDSACDEREIASDDGTLLGQAEVCLFVYSFDALRELDLQREHGAVWLQGRFTPADGWCATEVSAGMSLEGAAFEKATKAGSKQRKPTTRLTLDARGNALETARISQSWSSFGKTTNDVGHDGDPTLDATWKGRSSKAVSLVAGLAYSHDVLAGPPDKIGYGFSRFSVASC